MVTNRENAGSRHKTKVKSTSESSASRFPSVFRWIQVPRIIGKEKDCFLCSQPEGVFVVLFAQVIIVTVTRKYYEVQGLRLCRVKMIVASQVHTFPILCEDPG